MTPDQAAWVRKNVIENYHEANQAHWWCGPNLWPDEPLPTSICYCIRRVTALSAPRPYWPPKNRPYFYAVWLAHARDATRPKPEPEPFETEPARMEPHAGLAQLGLFAEVN